MISPDLQLIIIFLAFVLAIVVAALRKPNGSSYGPRYDYDKALQDAQESASFWRSIVLDSFSSRMIDVSSLMVERLNYLEKTKAAIQLQIARRGGESYAPPDLLVQLSSIEDEIDDVRRAIDENKEPRR